MKDSKILGVPFMVLLAIAPLGVHSAELLKLPFDVIEEKRNVILHFDSAGIGSFFNTNEKEQNAFIGHTEDFGGRVMAWVMLKKPMTVEQSMAYADYQFRHYGEAKCEMVHKVSSPMIPPPHLAIVGQNCAILFIAHK